MNWKRMMLGVGIVLLLGGGIYFAYTQFFAPDSEVEDPAIAEGVDANDNVVNVSLGVVSAEGNIAPLRDASLSYQTGGEVVEIIAEKGTVINVGDPIMRLDATDQEIALIQAQAAYEIAQANKQTAEAGLLAAETGGKAADVR